MVGHILYEELAYHHKHFAIMMSGLARKGLWRSACALLDEMRTRGLEPNVICYNIALEACRRGHQWQYAFELYDTMQERAAVPDVISYTSLITACETGSRWAHSL